MSDRKNDERKEDCKGSECFFIENSFSGVLFQPCDGIPRAFFEDLTDQHNKIAISATSRTLPPCRVTLIIETDDTVFQRDLEPPNFAQLFELSTNIQAENVRRISVLCRGNPTGNCSLGISLNKTFAFCCPDETDKKRNGHKSNPNRTRSFAAQHGFIGEVLQPCDGSATVVFEDRTPNHNSLFFQSSSPSPPCQATLLIETDRGTVIRELNPNSNLVLQIEDVRRIAVRCQGNPASFCNFFFSVNKTFCIGTTSSKSKSVDKGRDYSK